MLSWLNVQIPTVSLENLVESLPRKVEVIITVKGAVMGYSTGTYGCDVHKPLADTLDTKTGSF